MDCKNMKEALTLWTDGVHPALQPRPVRMALTMIRCGGWAKRPYVMCMTHDKEIETMGTPPADVSGNSRHISQHVHHSRPSPRMNLQQ